MEAIEKITSRKNTLAMHMKALGAHRRYREERGEFLCDGLKLLEDAARCGAEIIAVITASPIPFPLPANTRVYHAQRSLIDSISPLKSAQDLLFTCAVPLTNKGGLSSFLDADTKSVAESCIAGNTHLLLDGMQDPGNVGTIVRTANALGIKSVILTGGCADLYNPKTVRATMGAIFRQRVFNMSLTELSKLKELGIRFIAASAHETCKDIREVSLTGAVIAIGNEGRGLSLDILKLCKDSVTIPISSESESLNAAAAAAIIMWEAQREVKEGVIQCLS